MKKFLTLALIISAFTISKAQYLPRWGSGPPTNDNTGRVLTYSVLQTAAILSTTDTVLINPKSYWTGVTPIGDTAKGTIIYCIKTGQNGCSTGDMLEFYGIAGHQGGYTPTIEFRNSNGKPQYLTAFKFQDSIPVFAASNKQYKLSDSTITLIKDKYYDVIFRFDGISFNEIERSIGH